MLNEFDNQPNNKTTKRQNHQTTKPSNDKTQMIHNPKIECMDRDAMRKLQSKRLIETVKRCYENVPFYKHRMDDLGIKPEDIKSIDDIHKLPFTTKHDLRDEYPFGLQAVPHEQIRRIHASSGTTGKPVVFTYTENEQGRHCSRKALHCRVLRKKSDY